MRLFIFFAGLAASAASCGCATFTRAEMNLLTQMQRGLAIISQHDQQRDAIASQLETLQRQRLDDAFDQDVQERAAQQALDPDWVIEARRAYAVALDAFAKRQAAAESSEVVRKQNLAAIDAALVRLRWMQSIRLKFDLLQDEVSK